MSLGRDGRTLTDRSPRLSSGRFDAVPTGSMARESGVAHDDPADMGGSACSRTARSKLSSDRSWTGARHHRPLSLAAGLVPRIQALDRSQPVLPMLPGMPERRNGTRCAMSPRAAHRQVLRPPPVEFLRKEIERPRGAGPPHRHGPLRHPQDRGGQGLAGAASAWHVHFNCFLQVGASSCSAAWAARSRHPRRKWTKSAGHPRRVKRFCLRVVRNPG